MKHSSRRPRAALGDMRTGAPLDRISIDLVGQLPETVRGNQHILVLTDHFSKWPEAYSVPEQTASTYANIVCREFITKFGCPLSIHTNQGRCFESELFQEVCHLLEIRKIRTTPRNPKCNGLAERFNKTIIQMIKSFIKEDIPEWDENLPYLTAAYRASVQESTRMTPNLVMLGRENRMPAELLVNRSREIFEPLNVGEYTQNLRTTLIRAYETARKHLHQAFWRQKDLYDQLRTVRRFQPTDAVLILNDIRKIGECRKLQPLYMEPAVVIGEISDLVYRVQTDQKGSQNCLNIDKFKKYIGDSNPSWIEATRENLN